MPLPDKQTFHEAGQSLTLRNLGTHVELRIGAVPILTSAALGTERDFGALPARFWSASPPAAARVLVGGLGFGATLQGALSVLGPQGRVVVVEKLQTVVDLLRGPLAHLAPGVLDDPRVELRVDDVTKVLPRERNLDAILLDVDNGPGWASFPGNDRLYGEKGLAIAHAALRSGGTYAVWSGYPADEFLRSLKLAGFAASQVPFTEGGRVQARAYVGRKG